MRCKQNEMRHARSSSQPSFPFEEDNQTNTDADENTP
jgi:hypothetical protein